MPSTEANSINAATAGIVGNTGTSFTGTAVSQYNVITGGSTTSTLNNVAPSATSGVPVISQGNAAQPVFGTAVVAGGGTGLTSTTAYAVLCGGTTTTGALQSIAGVGTSGQVLTSNGAGALPTFQAAASGGITTIDGDSGSVTGSTVTITGGTTGLTTSGSSSTLTLGGTLGIANGGTDATSFTQSNGIVTYNGTRLVNYAGPQISSGGVATNTSQPAFSAYPSASITNVTGDGTTYTVIWDTKLFDQGTNYNTGTGGFTCPVAGIYLFNTAFNLIGLTSAMTSTNINIVNTTSGQSFWFGEFTGASADSNGRLGIAFSTLAKCSASDVVNVQITVSGSTKNAGIIGSAVRSYFQGYLVC
jgi:hypothetical protein